MPRKGPVPRPAENRFWAKVIHTDDCWLWDGARLPTGYGRFWDGTRVVNAHRWAYEALFGPIPVGLVLDHLCRVTRCVRPSHLEAVTESENVRRGSGAAFWRDKTHCPKGHPYAGDNLRILPGSGARVCRTCERARVRAA